MHRLFVMSVDSLFTSNLADVRRMPGFSQVLERAAVFENVYAVYPTLTYVCHASIMTGCWPDRHGVPHNQVLDPATGDREWYWGYDSLRVPTIFDWARRAGRTCASVGWPVTAAAEAIDVNVPEVWVADPAKMRDELMPQALDDVYRRGCSPAGLALYERHKNLLVNNATPYLDEFDAACCEEVVEDFGPDVLLTHQAHLDHVRHSCGVDSPQVQDALRFHDPIIQRCLESMRRAGTLDDTVFVILGDHGHLRVDYKLCPNVLLAQAGLIDLDARGVPAAWQAYVQSGGISAQLFARDATALERARSALEPLVGRGLVTDVLTREEARRLHHAAGDFALMMEAAPNYAFGAECAGELVRGSGSEDYRYAVSTHGHLPSRGPRPPFVVAGPGVEPGRYAGARLVDEAPTLMRLVGIPYDEDALDGTDLFGPSSPAVRVPGWA
ncbi:MAG: alkaline phosphatase family protein [Olsenella sp.]|jgi:predicted AlkP superfamily pyrophosphatase or phosphodiesterase